MNLYAAPGAQSKSPSLATPTEDDILAAAPPFLSRVAGGIVALAGVVVALTGLQTLLIVTVRGFFAVAPYVLLLLGAGEVVLGAVVFRARVWGALVAAGTSLVLVILSAVWLFFSFGHGLLSLFALTAPFGSGAAAVLAFLAIEPSQRASAARARLREQGMNLGI
jgi:hypothetical protein